MIVDKAGLEPNVDNSLLRQMRGLVGSFRTLTFYERFERSVFLVLTMIIIAIVASGLMHLTFDVAFLILSDELNPANQGVFQAVFGMIFTIMIALEFKHSLLISLPRRENVVRVRSIILIAKLAMVRKFIAIDLGETPPLELFALSAAILAIGVVYWIVRDVDPRHGRDPAI
jgi:uncharacterized membrane protein (DUF373 family)